MAKRSGILEGRGGTLPENDDIIDMEEIEEVDTSVSDIISDLQGKTGVSVRIYSEPVDGPYRSKKVFITEWSPEEFSLMRLQNELGGGAFRIHIKKDGGFIKGGNAQVIVAPPPKASVPVVATVHQNDDGLRGLIEAQNRTNEIMLQMLAKQNAPQPNNSLENAVGLVSQIAGIFRQSAPPASNGLEGSALIDIFTKGMELGKSVNGSSETNGNEVLLETIKTLGPVFANAMVNKNVPVRHKVTSVDHPKQIQPNPVRTEEDVLAMFTNSLKTLVNAARVNGDVNSWANVVIDSINENDEEQFFNFISSPNCVDELIKINPDVQTYRAWFENLRLSLLTDSAEDDIKEEIPGGEDGKIIDIASGKDSNT